MMLTSLVNAIMALADPVMLREFLNTLLLFVEEHVRGTASKIDDAMILPICSAVRTAFNVPIPAEEEEEEEEEVHVSPVYKPE